MKRLVVEIDDTLHKKIRSAAFQSEKTMKQYVTDVLKEQIEKNEQKNKSNR